MSSGTLSSNAVSLKFGTDGVRGIANIELTAQWAVRIGRIAAKVLGPQANGFANGSQEYVLDPPVLDPQPLFVIGRDTRVSGEMLSPAISAGVASEGINVIDLGVITTPGVAWVSEKLKVPAVVISASHNVYSDNGIKFFSSGGNKLSDSEQLSIEKLLDDDELLEQAKVSQESHSCGRISYDASYVDNYIDYLVGKLRPSDFRKLSVVIDCANGAASKIAPRVFGALGITMTLIGCEPNGTNINDQCGSTDLKGLREEVVRRKADLGIAFDGDADRCLAVDENSNVIDGDQMMAMFAIDLKRRESLRNNAIVITSMANLGLRNSMRQNSIEFYETDVGDRNVLSEMDRRDVILGGEQSGHLIFRDVATTGDGILTALKLIELLNSRKDPLSVLAGESMQRLPQSLLSIDVANPAQVVNSDRLKSRTDEIIKELGDEGRVVIRPSGTEPKIRVMVEASHQNQADTYAKRLVEVIVSEVPSEISL